MAAVAAVPLAVTNDYWLGVLIVSMYFVFLAGGWNLLAGYAGQFSLAPATFAMLGAYGTGLLAYHWQVPAWASIPAGILAAALIGMTLGRIVMRLRGPYLALTTLSFAEIMRIVIGNSYDFTRGDLGLSVPALTNNRLVWYYVFVATVVLMQLALYALLRSRAGLYLMAIRDDEIGAASRGINTAFWKTAAFTLSTALAGLAGVLYAHFSSLVSPELGLILQTGLVICMVFIGGIASLVGPVFGAFLVYLASEALREAGGVQLIVFALLVILIARFFREGLWGLARRLLERPAP
ncbi:MAG: branched-chain amino acid ABC transporter permease [Burkholderiales bacterium]|nr:branched-chain amino acid ABC transporter permease [Burkholderiales bacterium]